MDGHLGNNISVFILIGFPTRPVLQSVLFTVFLIIYILTLIENVVIIITVKINITLHKPMYYFLGSLSFLEIWYVTVTIPNLLNNFITQDRKIYFFACMAQLYIFISLACTECFLLAVMAFDRYVAICIPLRYTVIMSDTLCLYLTIVSWLLGFAIAMVKIVFIFRMSFCGPNIINHFFCDVSPILNLACSDVSLAQFVDFILGMIELLLIRRMEALVAEDSSVPSKFERLWWSWVLFPHLLLKLELGFSLPSLPRFPPGLPSLPSVLSCLLAWIKFYFSKAKTISNVIYKNCSTSVAQEIKPEDESKFFINYHVRTGMRDKVSSTGEPYDGHS
ncbi:olfactory receptor 6B9-like [Leptodactylus fuscus]